MQHPSNDWNPDSKVQLKKKSGIQYLESGIHGVESRIYYDCLGFPYMGRTDKLHTGGRPYLAPLCKHLSRLYVFFFLVRVKRRHQGGFPQSFYELCVHMHVNDAKFEIILQSNTLSSNLSVEKTITP